MSDHGMSNVISCNANNKCYQQLTLTFFNPLVPDAHYSEPHFHKIVIVIFIKRHKPFSLQIQQLEVDLK